MMFIIMKQSIHEEIESVIKLWDIKQMLPFIQDIGEIFYLYDVDVNHDWVKDAVGKDDFNEIRIIRTVYLISKLAERHAGRLCNIKAKHPNLWKRLENVK